MLRSRLGLGFRDFLLAIRAHADKQLSKFEAATTPGDHELRVLTSGEDVLHVGPPRWRHVGVDLQPGGQDIPDDRAAAVAVES